MRHSFRGAGMAELSQPSRVWPLVAAGFMVVGALGLAVFGRGMYDSPGMLLEAGPEISGGVFMTGWATLAAAVFALGAMLLAGCVAFGRAVPSFAAGVSVAVCSALVLLVATLVAFTGLQSLRVLNVIAMSAVVPRAEEIAPHVYSAQDWMQGAWIALFVLSIAIAGVLSGARWRHNDRGMSPLGVIGVVVTVLGAMTFVAGWIYSGSHTSQLLNLLVAEATPRPSELAGHIFAAQRGGVVAGASLALTAIGLGCVLLGGSLASDEE
jgi:hypothetical protein